MWRAWKQNRVYEMVKDPTARAMVGYLLVRGGVHIVAYARALEKLKLPKVLSGLSSRKSLSSHPLAR